MRAYQVQVQGKVKRYAGSMAECRAAKKEIMEADPTIKAGSVSYEECEIPTSKSELIPFLNENCVQ